jgi:hypothetical protein
MNASSRRAVGLSRNGDRFHEVGLDYMDVREPE